MFREIGLEKLPIPVVLIFKEQDRLDTVAPEQQRLVRKNCGRYAPTRTIGRRSGL